MGLEFAQNGGCHRRPTRLKLPQNGDFPVNRLRQSFVTLTSGLANNQRCRWAASRTDFEALQEKVPGIQRNVASNLDGKVGYTVAIDVAVDDRLGRIGMVDAKLARLPRERCPVDECESLIATDRRDCVYGQ